jgi:hypothetical protein
MYTYTREHSCVCIYTQVLYIRVCVCVCIYIRYVVSFLLGHLPHTGEKNRCIHIHVNIRVCIYTHRYYIDVRVCVCIYIRYVVSFLLGHLPHAGEKNTCILLWIIFTNDPFMLESALNPNTYTRKVYIHTGIIYVCMYVCIYIYVCVCVCVYRIFSPLMTRWPILTRKAIRLTKLTCMHAYIHTYIHICITSGYFRLG